MPWLSSFVFQNDFHFNFMNALLVHHTLVWILNKIPTSSMRTQTKASWSSIISCIFWNIFITSLPLWNDKEITYILTLYVDHKCSNILLKHSLNTTYNKTFITQFLYKVHTSENHFEKRLWLLISINCP